MVILELNEVGFQVGRPVTGTPQRGEAVGLCNKEDGDDLQGSASPKTWPIQPATLSTGRTVRRYIDAFPPATALNYRSS